MPDTVGVPDTTPVALAMVTPAGNPVAAYEYGVVPPLAVTGVNEPNAVPCVAEGIDPNAVVSVVGPPPPLAVTLKLNVKVIVWPIPSTTCMLYDALAADTDGVPDSVNCTSLYNQVPVASVLDLIVINGVNVRPAGNVGLVIV